jgi:hypothetical protein
LRILCLGIGNQDNKNYTYVAPGSSLSSTTIFDYEMVILSLPVFLQTPNSYYFLSLKKNEFQKFFENNGVCFVISEEYYKGNNISNYDWCPFSDQFKIENKPGVTIEWIDRKAKSVFGTIDFKWDHFFYEMSSNCKPLAINRTKDALSIIVSHLNGYCVFLPNPYPVTTNVSKLYEVLLFKGLEVIPEAKREVTNGRIPSWANTVASNKELSLIDNLNQISKKLGKYSKFKQLYWESGEALESLVIDAFNEFGLEVDKLPKGSHADFEIKLDDGVIGVCEVKGLSGSASLQDLRQLLDYFIDQRDIEQRNVKGIIIVNHYRNEEPYKRGDPVTKDAIDLMKKHKFLLLTTIEIYEMLEKHWNGELTKDYLIKLLSMNK